MVQLAHRWTATIRRPSNAYWLNWEWPCRFYSCWIPVCTEPGGFYRAWLYGVHGVLDPRWAVQQSACSEIWLAFLSEHLFMWKLHGLRKAASVGLGGQPRPKSSIYVFLSGTASERMHHARPHASLSVQSIDVGPVPLFP